MSKPAKIIIRGSVEKLRCQLGCQKTCKTLFDIQFNKKGDFLMSVSYKQDYCGFQVAGKNDTKN